MPALLQELGLVLRTLGSSLRSFEKGNGLTRFVFEETTKGWIGWRCVVVGK